jgi:hypothetical protein
MTDGPRYLLTVEAQPGPVPAPVRLRRMLKYALRVCGLRCLSAEEMPTTPQPPVDCSRIKPDSSNPKVTHGTIETTKAPQS